MEDIKKIPDRLLEMKTAITEMKNKLVGVNGSLQKKSLVSLKR